MLRSEDFLTARLGEVGHEIEAAAASARLVAVCPSCQKPSFLIGDGYPSCLVCGNFDIDPTDAADDYALSHDHLWRHQKHGVDDEVAWCECCGLQAVVPVGEDLQQKAEAAMADVEREPGEDWEYLVCMGCGEFAINLWLHDCSSCGARYIDSRRERSCPACRF